MTLNNPEEIISTSICYTWRVIIISKELSPTSPIYDSLESALTAAFRRSIKAYLAVAQCQRSLHWLICLQALQSPCPPLLGEARRACRGVARSLTNWHGCFGKDRYHLSVDLSGTSEENISLLNELMEAMATCLQDYCPRGSAHFSLIIHEDSIQVKSRPFQCVIAFIIDHFWTEAVAVSRIC